MRWKKGMSLAAMPGKASLLRRENGCSNEAARVPRSSRNRSSCSDASGSRPAISHNVRGVFATQVWMRGRAGEEVGMKNGSVEYLSSCFHIKEMRNASDARRLPLVLACRRTAVRKVSPIEALGR